MTTPAARMFRSAILAAVAIGMASAPSVAAEPDNGFELSTTSVSAYGTYDRMMSIPEQLVPPIAVSATLAVNNAAQCGVVQIGYNGPLDDIRWRTFGHLCGRGKTSVRTTSGLLWGDLEPPVRLCRGTSVARAERGTWCDTWAPQRAA